MGGLDKATIGHYNQNMSPSEIQQIFQEINIQLNGTESNSVPEAVFILLQLVERLNEENEKLRIVNQKLRDENNLLKGEQGKPNVLGNKKKDQGDVSSERDRKEREEKGEKKSKAKVDRVKIDRIEICEVDKSELPPDAEFKGYETVVVQEIVITTNNIAYKKEKYYSPSENKTYLGKLPIGVNGEFGPGIKALVCTLKHVGNMSEPKIQEFHENCGIFISQSTISRILTGDQTGFNKEKMDIFRAALDVCPYHQIDDTTIRVNGENKYSQIFCNPCYTAFFTVSHKNRLAILDILLCGKERTYLFDSKAFDLLSDFNVSNKICSRIKQLASDREMSDEEMQELLGNIFTNPKKGKNTRSRIMEAAAIASYQRQTDIPIVEILLSDDAPQFKKLVLEHALCWIHEGRHYNRLSPIIPLNVGILADFKTCFWNYYRELLKYKENPTAEKAEMLAAEFDRIFSTKTGYKALDERIEKTRDKKEALLLVLKYPELPLHNNDSELGARVEKRRQDVSLQIKSEKGTDAKDSFLTVTQTAKKLGVNAYKYIYDRISKEFRMPSLADLIVQKFQPQIE